MYSETSLEIVSQEQPVPHVFYRQEEQPENLAVLLPGYNYSNDMPLLYFVRSLLLKEIGSDVLQVDYAYNRIPGFTDLPAQTRYARLESDVTQSLSAALAERSYQRLMLIGKSLGTAAMALLLPRAAGLPAARWVWLTPLLTDPNLTKAIRAYKPASLFVTGTADRYYQAETLEALCAATVGKAEVIEDADHRLEIPGSAERSLEALSQVVTAVKRFLT